MRTALVTTSFPRDASDPSGHFVRAEMRALVATGDEVLVVAPTAGGAFGWPGVAARLRENPLRAIEVCGWITASRRSLAHSGAEKVIAHWAVPCAWPIGAAAPVGAALEAVSHGGDVRLLAALPGRVRRRIVGSIAGRARTWRFVSESLLDRFLGTLDRRTRARVEAIAAVRPSPLEFPDVRDAIARRRAAFTPSRLAVTVGRLVASKRVDRSIDHVAGSPGRCTLIVVGDGPERPRLERLARERRVDARFVGLVGREEALSWIGAADVLLHASEAEGLSTVVREAEALGTPVMVL